LSVWGLIVAGGLVAGAATLLVGLVVVLRVLGHSTWHISRMVVEPAAPVPAAAAARGRRKNT
jgi:uncharacterized membrane protein